MNRIGVLADGLFAIALSFITLSLAQGNLTIAPVAVTLGVCLLTYLLCMRVPHHNLLRGGIVGVWVIAVLTWWLHWNLAYAIAGTTSLILFLLRRMYFTREAYEHDVQVGRLVIDIVVLIPAMLLSLAAPSSTEVAAGIFAMAIAARIIAMRTAQIAESRAHGLTAAPSLHTSLFGVVVLVAGAVIAIVLVPPFRDIIIIAFLLISVVVWLRDIKSQVSILIPVAILALGYWLRNTFLRKMYGHLPHLAHAARGGRLPQNTHSAMGDPQWILNFLFFAGICMLLWWLIRQAQSKRSDATQTYAAPTFTREKIQRPRHTPQEFDRQSTPLRALTRQWLAYQIESGRSIHLWQTLRSIAQQSPETSSVQTLVTAYEAERYGEMETSPADLESIRKALTKDGQI